MVVNLRSKLLVIITHDKKQEKLYISCGKKSQYFMEKDINILKIFIKKSQYNDNYQRNILK